MKTAQQNDLASLSKPPQPLPLTALAAMRHRYHPLRCISALQLSARSTLNLLLASLYRHAIRHPPVREPQLPSRLFRQGSFTASTGAVIAPERTDSTLRRSLVTLGDGLLRSTVAQEIP